MCGSRSNRGGGNRCAPFDHHKHVLPCDQVLGKFISLPDRPEQGPLLSHEMPASSIQASSRPQDYDGKAPRDTCRLSHAPAATHAYRSQKILNAQSRSGTYPRKAVNHDTDQARSRGPLSSVTSIESHSCRAWSADSTGVLPRFTTYLGPRTAPAGYDGKKPPVTR
jgi:hypothetical protein